jgi:ketosteroid isomerase-like protein
MTGRLGGVIAGAFGALLVRSLLVKLILVRLRRDVARLNEGDYRSFLAAFADDAVLHFNEGAHRWSGDHRGKQAIERFLRDFTAAGLRGEIGDVWLSGPPWALKLVARFDDEAVGPEGERLYSNKVVVVVRTRWGKIVEQEDFYHDTARMQGFEQRLQELGILAVPS